MIQLLKNLPKCVADLKEENSKLRALKEQIKRLTTCVQEKLSKVEENSKLVTLEADLIRLITRFQEEYSELQEEKSKLRALIEDFERLTTRFQSSNEKFQTGSSPQGNASKPDNFSKASRLLTQYYIVLNTALPQL